MTLPGGPAAKRGNRYEKLWTLSELVRMLRGETESMRIEKPGLDGAEFVVHAGAKREFHQVKRSHPNGKWSIATLKSAGVLASISHLLRDSGHRFVFASGSDAPELRSLCEAATDAKSIDEFRHDFLAAKVRAATHKHLLSEWNLDEQRVWEMLRRIDVRTINDHELKRKVAWGLAPLFINVDRAQEKLSAILDGAVHRTIEREELIRDLRESGLPLRQVHGDAGRAVIEATDAYLAGARRSLINGALIRRSEAAEVIARLTGDHAADCILTGGAGMGKTACVVEIAEGLRQAGVLVLAFRLDRHMDSRSTRDLGERLDLEESPTVILGAAAKAVGKRAVLIIDQLDAVSAMSGRTSGAFDVVARLLEEAKPIAVRTLIVCRSFDWHHDPQLRSLAHDEDQRTNLDKLTTDEVAAVLSAAHLAPEAFSPKQLELLRIPQNLSLLLDSGTDKPEMPSFKSTKDLFDDYWNHKRQRVEQRTQPASDQWVEVIRTVCEKMTEAQQLSMSKEKLDQFSPSYLHQYVSENVLTADRDTYGFGHESFFDYCFARLFAAGDGSLVNVLKGAKEQHLFRRAQVRQVLVYLRDADFKRYVREVHELVRDDGIRAHIKDLVFALLADVDDPTDEEWDLWMDWVRPVLDAMDKGVDSRDGLARRAWGRLFWASPWFMYFDDRSVIGGWLAGGNPDQVDAATRYLGWHQRHRPGRVAALLEPYADKGGHWAVRLRDVMASNHLHNDRGLFDLSLRLVDNGVFDDPEGAIPGFGLWEACWGLADRQPAWVPELLAHQLRRRIGRKGDAEWRDGLDNGGAGSEAIKIAGEREPRTFVDHVLPAVLDVAGAALRPGPDGTPPVRDAMWPFLTKGEALTDADACLHALADALAALAGGGDELGAEIAKLSKSGLNVANFLLLALYRGGATRYADEAVIALCDQPWRFDCGYTDSPFWCATETIRATVRHCESVNRAKLERTILAYVDPYERTTEGVRHRGYASFNLLAAVPADLRSAVGKRKFSELERKFRQPYPEPRGVVAGVVGSPIPTEAEPKMSDDDWVNAIDTYPSSGGRSLLEGGAVELARRFGARATKEPTRFATIGLRLPSTTNSVYFSELLRGLASTSVADPIKVSIARRVFEYAKDECGGEIAEILTTTSATLADGEVQMLVSLATEPHDANEEAWRYAERGQLLYDIHTNGINTTRGRAAQAIAKLIGKDSGYIQRFGPTLDKLAQEPQPSVAACVAAALRVVAHHDVDRGLDLFQRMDLSEERLLSTHHMTEFVRENMWRGLAKLEAAISRALRSEHADVRQAGARLACLAERHHAEAHALAMEARRGDVHQRLGVAEVAAANIGDGAHREWCEDTLRALFSDRDAAVRKAAATCFRHIPKDRVDAYGELIASFCSSQAYDENPTFLLYQLRDARSQLPGSVCQACESFLDRLASQARDIRQRSHGDGYTVVDLVFRLYQHHQNDEWASRALDLIDRVCLELDGAAKGFEDFER